MEKKQAKAKQKASLLVLHRETLRLAGASRGRIPIGFADDTTPIYSEEDEP
jgi:hypothetical protein